MAAFVVASGVCLHIRSSKYCLQNFLDQICKLIELRIDGGVQAHKRAPAPSHPVASDPCTLIFFFRPPLNPFLMESSGLLQGLLHSKLTTHSANRPP
jgi:hypothetical protein